MRCYKFVVSVLSVCGIITVSLRYASTSQGRAKLEEVLSTRLNDIKEAGTWKYERVITTPQSMIIMVENNTKPLINFCANNYLGLSNHPEVVEDSKKALLKYGAGLSSVRFICGTQDIHKDLESKISSFHGKDDTILYISCFDANAGLFESLLTPDDAVFSDELNHASIIDGIRLCKAKKFRYKHRNVQELESMLKESDARLKLIVTDGVFSMDGNVAPLKDIVDAAHRHDAIVCVDECHATGFFGETGRGTEEYCQVLGQVDIINSTLGKAVSGGSGGYTTGPKSLIQLLRNVSRPYLFSNTPPPSVVAAAAKALELVEASDELRIKLQSNTKMFRDGMREVGFDVKGDNHPICPVMIGDAVLASEFAKRMLDYNIYVIAFSYPVVLRGLARVRVQISAAHEREHIAKAISAFTKVGKQLSVIPH